MEFGWAAADPVLVVGFKSPRWEISALAAQIESDRVSKIKFRKQGTGIPMQKNKYPQPGLQFWSNSKSCRNSFIHVGTWALGQPCSGLLIPWPRNALWTSEVVITEEDWAATVGEIVSQQTSSHIEPSWRWEEKSSFSFCHFYHSLPEFRHLHNFSSSSCLAVVVCCAPRPVCMWHAVCSLWPRPFLRWPRPVHTECICKSASRFQTSVQWLQCT